VFQPVKNVSGGASSLAPFPQRGILIVAATDNVHAMIRKLLREIRSARKATGYQPTAGKPDPAELVARIYRPYPSHCQGAELDAALLEVVRPLITKVIGKTIDDTHYVIYLPDRIVVRHRRDVQVKLERRLSQLGFDWRAY